MWVRCCSRVAVMGVEKYPLSKKKKDAPQSGEQHGGCKKGILYISSFNSVRAVRSRLRAAFTKGLNRSRIIAGVGEQKHGMTVA
ncbi:hypothetical protein TNCV_3712411 [Trichonephila clavipes]|nr:hypothetical protein TNCV_3712411 [Trichonephila clavipes]